MLKEKQRLEQQISSLQKQLEQYPEGDFFCVKNGPYYKWIHKLYKKQINISKKNREFAAQMAMKKYLTLHLQDLREEKEAIDLYLTHHNSSPHTEQLLAGCPEYSTLLSSFQPLSQELTDWMYATYNHNPQFPEHLTHTTISGHLVRSKSEALIATFLHMNHIPFRYECELHLGSSILYPDFTIRHPRTGKLYYWEHFGLMDDPSYSKKAFSKLHLYTTHGIIPSFHLITTYETKLLPLTSQTIEKLIHEYFL